MIRTKILAIVTCGILVTTGITCISLVSNNNCNNKKIIENHTLLAAPNLNNLAVVINTNTSPLVLYSSPNSNSSIASYISIGEILNYTATNNPNFYKVTVQETGSTGYISANDMQIVQSGLNKTYENTNENGQIINVTYDVKLMSSPDVHSQILGSYKNSTPITILGKQDQWYKIKIGNQTGYMYEEYVGINANQQKLNNTKKTSIPVISTKNSNINVPSLNNKTNNTISNTPSQSTNNAISNTSSQSTIIAKNYALGSKFIQLGNEAYTLKVPITTLRSSIFNSIKNKIPNSGYINLTQTQANIVENGTTQQKEKLMNKLGKNKLIINITLDSKVLTTTSGTTIPNIYNNSNKKFYYSFNVTTLNNLCKSINNWPYFGYITSQGQLLPINEYNELCNQKNIYLLNINSQEPAYPLSNQVTLG